MGSRSPFSHPSILRVLFMAEQAQSQLEKPSPTGTPPSSTWQRWQVGAHHVRQIQSRVVGGLRLYRQAAGRGRCTLGCIGKDGGSQVQGGLYPKGYTAMEYRAGSTELGVEGLPVPMGASQARSSSQVLLCPRHFTARPACGNSLCRSSRSWGERTTIKPHQRGFPTTTSHQGGA